ncbi:MAG: hypothetical protein ACLTAF_16380 [Blautia coccoides]
MKKNDDGITVNGRWAYVKTILRTGDELNLSEGNAVLRAYPAGFAALNDRLGG